MRGWPKDAPEPEEVAEVVQASRGGVVLGNGDTYVRPPDHTAGCLRRDRPDGHLDSAHRFCPCPCHAGEI